jgi:hypothetical protein
MLHRLLALALFALLTATSIAAEPDKLTLLDGTRTQGTITAIDAAGRISATGIDKPIDLMALRQIARPAQSAKASPTALEVHLASGGVMLVDSAAVSPEAVTVAWKYAPKLAIPSEAVRAVRFASEKAASGRPADTPQGRAVFAEALAKPLRDKDHLLAIAEGKVQQLSGLLQEWKDKELVFEWENQPRAIALDRVYGIVFAQLTETQDSTGQCVVALRDGSSVSGKLAGLADGKLSLQLTARLSITLPWDDVTAVTVKSDRLVFLSDNKPTEVRQRPIVTLPRSWQADKNVLGGPLRIAGRSFDKGIGVHSRCELVFAQPGSFEVLAAAIGLDDSAGKRGDCEFVVLGDGKELFRGRKKGGEEPQEIRVSTAGAKQITLLVEPGADLDLADHADWGDVRLLRSAESGDSKTKQ